MNITNKTRGLGWIGLIALALAACNNAPSKPSVSGTPPEFLAGIWAVYDSLTVCEPFAPTWPFGFSVDTICPGGPDFACENARCAWRLNQESFGYGTSFTCTSCSGVISDTSIDVICNGTDEFWEESTGEMCPVWLTVHTQGHPDSNGWLLIRSIQQNLDRQGVWSGTRGYGASLPSIFYYDEADWRRALTL